MTNQPKVAPILEPADPVAHPHYPKRPLHASRPSFEVIEEFDESEQVDD